jgi:hypothetical protein
VRGREVVLAVDFDARSAFPSFPIFWADVINFLANDEWLVRRTFAPAELADGRTVRPERVGANRFGPEIIHANLLDRRASDLQGASRPFDPYRIPPPPAGRRRRDLSAWPAVAALVLVVVSWALERKV